MCHSQGDSKKLHLSLLRNVSDKWPSILPCPSYNPMFSYRSHQQESRLWLRPVRSNYAFSTTFAPSAIWTWSSQPKSHPADTTSMAGASRNGSTSTTSVQCARQTSLKVGQNCDVICEILSPPYCKAEWSWSIKLHSFLSSGGWSGVHLSGIGVWYSPLPFKSILDVDFS